MEQSTNQPQPSTRPEHNSENTWFDGSKWIPLAEMTNTHLRRAKLYAQKKEEFFWKKSSEFAQKVVMLDQEAQRRGIIARDYKSTFTRNTRKMKQAIEKMP